MNYKVKAFRIVSHNEHTTLEDYEKDVPNYVEVEKEMNRLRSLGEYVHITYSQLNKETLD
jgi:hypothetical protein